MTDRIEIEKLLSDFTKRFPAESATVKQFADFVGQFKGVELYDRKNFTGHITVSALVADHCMQRFLMLEHVQLKKWLQPGGHVELCDEDVLHTAFREVEEETGIGPDRYDVMCTSEGVAVIDFDSHYIPPCDYKNEDEHWHHDIRFLFRLKSDNTDVALDTTESKSCKWISLEEFPSHFGINRMSDKITLFNRILL